MHAGGISATPMSDRGRLGSMGLGRHNRRAADVGDIGRALREAREQAGHTQESLAEATGLALKTVQAIEAGRRGGRVETLGALARALGCQTVLFVPPGGISDRAAARRLDLEPLREALHPPLTFAGAPLLDYNQDGGSDVTSLRLSADGLSASYFGGDYDAVLALAPALLESAYWHASVCVGAEQTQAHWIAADLLCTVSTTLIQLLELDLATSAAQRAALHASQSGDLWLHARALDWMAWSYQRSARFDLALQVSAKQFDGLSREPESDDQLVATGLVALRAAHSAACDQRPQEAQEHWEAAEHLAQRFGRETSAVIGRYGFGLATVAFRAPELQMVGGNPDRALELIGRIPPTWRPSALTGANRGLLVRAQAQSQVGKTDEAWETMATLLKRDRGWAVSQPGAKVLVGTLARAGALSVERRALASAYGVAC